jgi:hypothetical protein
VAQPAWRIHEGGRMFEMNWVYAPGGELVTDLSYWEIDNHPPEVFPSRPVTLSYGEYRDALGSDAVRFPRFSAVSARSDLDRWRARVAERPRRALGGPSLAGA